MSLKIKDLQLSHNNRLINRNFISLQESFNWKALSISITPVQTVSSSTYPYSQMSLIAQKWVSLSFSLYNNQTVSNYSNYVTIFFCYLSIHTSSYISAQILLMYALLGIISINLYSIMVLNYDRFRCSQVSDVFDVSDVFLGFSTW